jgi:hypothetical protein
MSSMRIFLFGGNQVWNRATGGLRYEQIQATEQLITMNFGSFCCNFAEVWRESSALTM